MKLTGKRRFRASTNWFGKTVLLLQVEVEGMVPRNVGNRWVDTERETWWRDATVEDLTEDQIVVK